MLIFSAHEIGNNLLSYRKKQGFTQAQVAELSGISDRTYADIERGTVNMRIETVLRICQTLKITPDDILTTRENALNNLQTDLFDELSRCTSKERKTALNLLSVYLQSLD